MRFGRHRQEARDLESEAAEGATVLRQVTSESAYYFLRSTSAAVKCNDTTTVLEVLAALGTGFDCASKTEINKILSLGVGPERIIFANPAKPGSHIRHAAAVGVDVMTFDSEAELHKVKELFPAARLVTFVAAHAR